ncbi:DUF58 domain-containing protein [Synechocystis sp. PCC 7509]|uniref:DUF58 domain-containing protein n=1 Tax=Synechocystis sp. PCC 7509 TaxID=927677 RepID=UPI0002ACFD4D|nr:DUF58 domain-containing protein [Synechocystis sp. PCC 7509]
MSIANRFNNWLETYAVKPDYSGWVLAGVAICFFGAAINTMAGWLYVISGLSFAILGIAIVLPKRALSGISIRRQSIQPVSVGDELTIELEINNQTSQPKTLLQIQDILPFVLGNPVKTAIEVIAPKTSYHWVYGLRASRRGVYLWQNVVLRTAAPLGLFWCRRDRHSTAKAIVYPHVFTLTHCPLIDEIGLEDKLQADSQKRSQSSNSGITRSLRPYRMGDAIRLIHWRTSARYGELRVRELEVITSGQEIVICLDSGGSWQSDNFEQAVTAAASLYFYAVLKQLNVKLWTASTGLIRGDRTVLEALAATNATEDTINSNLPPYPLIWLSENSQTLNSLPPGSRWVLWLNSSQTSNLESRQLPGLTIQAEQSLQLQLQKPLI